MEIYCQVRSCGASSAILRAVTSVMVALVCSPTFAESADGPAAADQGDSSHRLETIVVTAERRTTDLQTTAIAATVLSGDDLTKKNINTLDTLAFMTPSLTVQSSGQNALVNIRGIGKSDGGAQVSSGVLIYRDGVSTTPNGLISDEPYYDIASIEVLRGPQGTFAGQNATGGAIFINEANPTLDRFNSWVEAQYGNYNDARIRGAVNIPLTDELAIRVATDNENRDTFFHMSGPYTGNPGKLHETNWRLSTLWQPNDAFKGVLKLDYNYIDHGGSPAGPYTGSTANVFNVASDAHLSGLEKQFRSVLQLSYRFADGVTLKSISGYQDGRLAYSLDMDGTATPPPLGLSPEVFIARATDRTTSEEVNLVSPDTGPFTWVLGGVYQNDDLDVPQFILSLAPGGTATTGLALSAAKDEAVRQSWGVFGQGSYELTKALKLQVGARYSRTSFTLTDIAQVLLSGKPLVSQSVPGETERDSRVTGKIDLDWTFDEHNFVYGFVATGHKGGGINGSGPIFKPENVTDYELGWKGNFFNNRIRTQFGAFYEDYTDFQLPIYEPTLGTGLDENAAGTTVVKGIEAQVQAAIGGLSLDIGTSYINTSLGQFSAIDSRNTRRGVQTLTGRPLPNAPSWTAQAGIQYAFAFGGGQILMPRVDYGFVGSRWATVFEVNPADRLIAENIFNAELMYEPSDSWKITAYATNLFDMHYVALQLLASLGQPGPPREYGIRLNKSF
jgi:iron complex outermembrane recepter protein